MQLFHIPQCSIQNRIVQISVLNGALWDMERVHSGIYENLLLRFMLCRVISERDIRIPGYSGVIMYFYGCMSIRHFKQKMLVITMTHTSVIASQITATRIFNRRYSTTKTSTRGEGNLPMTGWYPNKVWITQNAFPYPDVTMETFIDRDLDNIRLFHICLAVALQGDCQWPLKNGGNSQWLPELTMHREMR